MADESKATVSGNIANAVVAVTAIVGAVVLMKGCVTDNQIEKAKIEVQKAEAEARKAEAELEKVQLEKEGKPSASLPGTELNLVEAFRAFVSEQKAGRAA